MKNIKIVIKENQELLEIPNVFDEKEILNYLGVLLERNISFESNPSYIMVMDAFSSQQNIIQEIVKKEYNPYEVVENIKEMMGVEASVNHDRNIDVLDTNFKEVGKICLAFGLELRHAYNGLSGADFELNVKSV